MSEWSTFFFVTMPLVSVCVALVVGSVAWALSGDDEVSFALRFPVPVMVMVGVLAFGEWVQR